MNSLNWQFAGPMASALRITGLGPNQGHVININLAYAPSDATQAAIAEHTATELSSAVFEISPDGSEVTERYQRLLGEIATAERKIAEIDDKIRELAAQQDAANVEAKPGLGKRLVRIGKKISALKKQRDDVAYEADLLGDVAARSRADTERALGAAFARQQMLALGCLQARRSTLEQEFLAAVSSKLTSLIAVQNATLRLRAGGAMHEAEVRRLVDSLPPIYAADEAVQDEADVPDPEPQSQCEPVAA